MKIKRSPLVVAGFLTQLLSTETQAKQISQHLDSLDSQHQRQSQLINKISAISFNKNSSNIGRTSFHKMHLEEKYSKKNDLKSGSIFMKGPQI